MFEGSAEHIAKVRHLLNSASNFYDSSHKGSTGIKANMGSDSFDVHM